MAYSTSTLAQGCFGKVYKQKYKDTWAAVKKVPQQLISRRDLERECEVYNNSEHPNIVKLLGNISLENGKWIIPLEFIFGEDLETTIFKSANSKILMTTENKGTIIVGMCEGLLHLHSKDIVHQDLKPENIMVEHKTNRAVIIDLGLAKFYRYGLNSAVDMGNEAYSAPEVLNRMSQRNQQSDVWAMGKIIAELCFRIRLYTPTVCPAKIKETMKDQPFCKVVCRMVEPDPSVRATMAAVISEIRRIGGKSIVTNVAAQTDHLKPPSSRIPHMRQSPSPMNRDASPHNRNPLPKNPTASPLNWERTPRPELKPLHAPVGMPRSPFRRRAGDIQENRAMTPAGETDITQQLLKMDLDKEVIKRLPPNLPPNGKVVVRHFEKKDGEVGKWVETEVVTRNGEIVQYKELKYDSK